MNTISILSSFSSKIGARALPWCLLSLVMLLAFCPFTTQAGFVGPSMITIDGAFADWTNNVYAITNATLSYKSSWDLDAYWTAMSTANGTSPASPTNRIQNVYYRIDVGGSPASTAYWIQMNLGVAPPGYADHIMQVFPNGSGTPAVSLTLFQFNTNSTTPYPAVSVFTVKSSQVTPMVSNDSGVGATNLDTNATGAFAANGSGYSIEIKLPMGWFTNNTYASNIHDDGTGPAFVETAVFSATGSKGAVGTPKGQINGAAGGQFFAQQSTTTGGVKFSTNNASGYAFSVGAAAATPTPVAGASDNITLTVNQNNSGTIQTDTTYTGTHSVIISGFTAAPNGNFGSLNGTNLTGSSVTINVTFASGVATIPLILDDAALQNIQFSISDLTVPEANVLAITPTAVAATQLAFITSPVTTTAGVASGTITVQRQDAYGNPNTTDASRTVTLSSDSTGTKTFTPASPLSISSGSSTVSFTYTDTKVGSPTLTAASTSPSSITSATQMETIAKATPSFSGLIASSSIAYGTTSITLSGKLSAAGPVYPTNGETITVTINGNAQTTTVNDLPGDFSINYNPSTLPASGTAYTVTYSYAGDSNLNTASDTSKTLTVNSVNQPPTLNAISNLTITEAAGLQTVNLSGITPGPTNESSQTVAITATSSDTSLIPNPTVNYTNPNGTGTLTFMSVSNALGTATVTVVAQDNGGTANGGVDSTTNTFTVTVLPLTNFWSFSSNLTVSISDATGAAGTGYTQTNYTGYLDVTAVSSNPFTINLDSAGGLAANFNNNSNYTWTIATTTRGVLEFAPAKIIVNTRAFTNDLAGGVFSVTTNGGSVVLVFTPNHAPVASPLFLDRAWATIMRIPIAFLLTNSTTDPDGDPTALSGLGASTNGTPITTNSSFILFAPTNNILESFYYTIHDVRSYRPDDTVRTTTNWITITVTNSIGASIPVSSSGGAVTLNFAGVPGYTYEVQRSTNLLSWAIMLITNAPPHGLWIYTDTNPPQPSAYYRLEQH